jgi:hypothetical protein
MMNSDSPFRFAALLLLLSAVLHIVVIIVSGGGFLAPMIAGAIMWFVIGAGLQRGMRWLAHIAFLLAMIGGVYVMGVGMGQTGLTQYALFGIIAADWIAAVLLFGALWKSPHIEET